MREEYGERKRRGKASVLSELHPSFGKEGLLWYGIGLVYLRILCSINGNR